MALADLQAFIVQKLQGVDPTLDLTPGSPYDVQVVQPILRRLGTDPFTVDIGLFIQTLLNQQFPDMPTKEGDAITDLLIKASVLLWNPVVREITRVKQVQSFSDPTTLTTDEADALGANLFATRDVGDFARVTVRVYFAQPQNISISPSNFFTTSTGLHFFPTQTQSIRVEEMLLNVESSLYYFDVSAVAEQAGDAYNIAPNNIVTIANVASAVRVTNKSRARFGTPDESATDFVGRIAQELTERSMVTSRGIVAQVTSAFAEVTRINSVGFNDPEMQRDILEGGGLGPILAAGFQMFSEADGENAVLTRRVSTAESVDFTALIGPTGVPVQGFKLTLHGAFPTASLPKVRDLEVLRVVDATTLDLVDQVLDFTASNVPWVLRQESLTLSGIPGGILFPNTPDGTITMPNDQVHIGGATDIYVRGQDFDAATLVLESIVDDQPLLQGIELTILGSTLVQLNDFVLGTNYSVGDSTYEALANAATENLSIQILDPPDAGSYRITEVIQTPGASPILTLTPALANVVAGNFRWRLSDELFIDLVEPKETRIAGSDMRTVQGTNVVDTVSGTDFADFGVSPNDILRITTGGLIVGDYTVVQVLSPLFDKLQVNKNLPATVNGAKYSVFRPNPEGGLTLPFVRVDSIDLLDTSNQPVGAKIPYANPIDCQSNGFANVARGVKIDVVDASLGIVTRDLTGGANVNGLTAVFKLPNFNGSDVLFTVTFTGSNPIALTTLVSQINTAVSTATTGLITRLAVLLDSNRRIGILPVVPNTQITSGTSLAQLFGVGHTFPNGLSTLDITSAEAFSTGGWAALRPALDTNFDVAQIIDGLQIGFFNLGNPPVLPFSSTVYDPLRTRHDFNPEVRTHLQVGARSLGTARVYFIDPTSFEVDANSRFTLTNTDGSLLRFFPDPTNNYQRIPALPSGAKPLDGATGGVLPSLTFESSSTDFVANGIQKGDLLSIDYIPLTGTVALADPVATLNAKTLILSINGGPDKTIIFVRDSTSIPSTDVTRAGVTNQINQIVGQTICALDGSNHLQFNPDASVIVRQTGTANTLLGFSAIADQNNDSPDKGTYVIDAVGPFGNVNELTVNSLVPFPTGGTSTINQQFKVYRAGLQRIVSTDMAKNVGTASLYFFDVQLVSEGTGDQYNIAEAQQLVVTGFRSDGYFLTTDDPDLTFSPVERPKLHLSRSILEVGVSDDPNNATQLAGQNIQINYSRSALVNDVNNFATSETERVINASPLARHLIPYFVRFVLTYFGGSAENVVIPDVQTYINALFPQDSLDVSDLEKIVNNRGATLITNPIDLIAVIHNFDRSITVERSQNKLNTGRLAAFIPDQLLITRQIS
jgi:hypothetical protein